MLPAERKSLQFSMEAATLWYILPQGGGLKEKKERVKLIGDKIQEEKLMR